MFGKPIGMLLLAIWCIYRGVRTFVPAAAQLEPIMSVVIGLAGVLLLAGV